MTLNTLLASPLFPYFLVELRNYLLCCEFKRNEGISAYIFEHLIIYKHKKKYYAKCLEHFDTSSYEGSVLHFITDFLNDFERSINIRI